MRIIQLHRKAMPYILAAYLLAVVVGFLYFNLRLNVEWVALVLLGAAVLSGRGLLFIRDWGVFLVVLLAWQVVSGIATQFSFPWHLTELIAADKAMFLGQVPPQWLQAHLYHPGRLEPWDVLAASMYMMHFLAPLAAGFLIWLVERDLFRRFAVAFVVVAVAGFVTYIVYPAVPPWYAAQPLVHVHGQYIMNSQHGHVYLPGVRNLFNVVMGRWYNPYHGTIYLPFVNKMHYDQVGAIPSEHAAYPFLFFLFLRRQFGRRAYLAWIYIVAIIFSITYMGQHYVIDAVLGFAYAAAGYWMVMHAVPAAVAWWHRTRPLAPRRSAVMSASELEEI